MEEQKLIFNNKLVRNSFKSRFCGEFILPSGKPSGYYKFPISDKEINEYMESYKNQEKPKGFFTWSEWALWTSLRCKYGVNYLTSKKQKFLSHIDNMYNPIKKEENLEEKMLFYCDNKLKEMLDLVLKSAENLDVEQDLENNKKNFRASLDNTENDVLY